MRANPIFFWTTFVAFFVATLFIPFFGLHQKDGSMVYVGTMYAGLPEIFRARELEPAHAVIVVIVVFHAGIIGSLAMLATSFYRHMTGEAYRAPIVFSSPEPTRSEWDTFLAGHDKD
jgi:hypothetical protein